MTKRVGKKQSRRPSRRGRSDNRNLLTIGVGSVGILAMLSYSQSRRNRKSIDEQPVNAPAADPVWQDYNYEAADYEYNRGTLGKVQYKIAGDTLSGYFHAILYSDKSRQKPVGSIFWNSIAHRGDPSKSIYGQNLQYTEQISIQMTEENRALFFMNAAETLSGYYEKDKPQKPVKYASGRINDQKNVSGTDYDTLSIIATDELQGEDTSGAPALLREVKFSDSSAPNEIFTYYYSNVDFKALK